MTELNLTSPGVVARILSEHGIKPSRAMGQNFLIDRNILDIIVAAAELNGTQKVLEIGPGLGVLTERLVKEAAHVTAIEKDDALFSVLFERWGGAGNPELIHADALDAGIPGILGAGVTHVVSNLPYSVGVRVLMIAAECENPPEIMVVLVQKEVAERFAAAPDSEDIGSVSVRLQRRYDVEVLHSVKPQCFMPRPDVMSSVVRFRRHGRWRMEGAQSVYFDGLVKAAFAHRRKQLASSMRSAGGGYARAPDFVRNALAAAGASPAARPGELSVEQWVRLSELWGA